MESKQDVSFAVEIAQTGQIAVLVQKSPSGAFFPTLLGKLPNLRTREGPIG